MIHFVQQSCMENIAPASSAAAVAAPRENSFSWRLLWWTVYAVAFGVTEAAVVAYLRRLLGMAPGLDYAVIWKNRGLTLDLLAFTREFSSKGLLVTELAREAGTLLLLFGAAMAAGRTARERWGIFAYTFAVWDLAYYLFLIFFTGFPRSLFDTDVYFLIPITWYGPVWFPVCVVMPLLIWLGIRAMGNAPLPTFTKSSARGASALILLLASLLTVYSTAHADDALARVRQRGELIVFSDATYPPFETVEGETIVGFDADIARELGKDLGVRVRVQNMEWGGVFPALETRKCDLVMSGVTITDERKKGNAFSRPYFLSGQVLVRKKGDSRINSPDDLKQSGIVVAVQQETTGQFAVEKRGLPKDRIHRFDALPDALLDLRNGNSQAAVGDLPALAALIRKGFPELEIVPGGPFVEENLGIVARPDARDLVAGVNAALERMLVDGRYAAAYEKWMGETATSAMIGTLARVADQGTKIPPEIAALASTTSKGKTAEPAAEAAPVGSAIAIRGDVLARVFPLLLQGARLTLLLTVLTLCIGVPLGLLVALARLSPIAPLRWLMSVYVEAVRGTPLLMQIYVIYFVLPAAGVSLPAFAAGLMALSLNAAAYVSEIFRAGIESIDSGQREAARALGMSGAQTMSYVILPQTVRRVLPPLTNEAVALLKDSSLVSVVALAELMRVGKELATNTGAPTTVYLAVALIYLVMTLPLTFLVRYLEVRWQPISRPRQRVGLMARTTPEQQSV